MIDQSPKAKIVTFEGHEITPLIRITVLAGQTFRGVKHFAERSYDVAPSLAAHVVAKGSARIEKEIL